VCSMVEEQVRGQEVPEVGCGIVIGIDVSKGWIDWRACRPGQWEKRHHLPQDWEGFTSLEQHLVSRRAQGQQVWVGLEPTGPYGLCLQEWFLERGWRVVQVNPYHVHRTKEIPDNSPRKDDEKDPGVIAELVWRGSYQQVRRVFGPYAELRAGISEWYSLTKKQTAARNEAQALLEVWFPEVRTLFQDPLCKSVRTLIRHYESPEALVRGRLGSLEGRLREGTHGRGGRYGTALREAAAQSVALREGQRSRVRALRGLLTQLEGYEVRREQLREELAESLAQTREGKYLLSVPLVGVVLAGGLLGECGPLAEFRRSSQVEKFVGLHLYGLASGKRTGRLHVSKRGRRGARALLGQLAALHVKAGGLCQAWAAEAKGKGKRPLQIQVAVARKFLRVMHALSTREQYFDPKHWHAGAQTADGVPVL